MSSNSSTSGQLIALPQGGGALHGIGETFAPDLYTGTGNFTIPIALPPGRNGFQPDLKLVHSTGNGNGPFGLGWSLSIPGVSRKTARGVPRYDDRDVFILSGAEDLVPVERPDATLTRYQPRTEGLFAEIFHHHSAADNYWEVRSKDGLVSIYGTPGRAATDPATLCDPDPTHTDRVFAWRLTETRDPFGNRIVYEYLDDEGAADNHRWRQPLLSRIRYIDYLGPNGPDYLVSVSFAYEARPDPFSSFRAGFEVRTTLRCTRIVVSTHAGRTRVQRVYHLVYLDQRRLEHFQLPANGVALLSQMWIEGRDDSSPNLLTNGDFRSVGPAGATTSFSGLHGGGNAAAANWSVWSNQHGVVATAIEPPAFAPAGPGMIHVTTSVPSGGLVQTFGAPGAGPDAVTAGAWIFVRRGRVGIGVGDGGNMGIDAETATTGRWEYLATPNGNAPANELIIYATSPGGAEFYVASAEVARAPRAEWLPPLEFSYSVFAPEQRRFAPLTGDDLPTRALGDPNLELVDLFGRGLPDVLELNGVARYWRNLGEGRFDRPRPMRAAPAGLALADPGVQLLDADGDGRIDLLVTRDGLAGYFPLAFDGGWDARSFRPYRQAPSFSLEDPTVKLLDLNGDGVIDALRGGARLECFFNDPRRGWTATRAVERRALERFPNVDFADPRVRLADMSGDQLQDIVLITDGEVAYWPNLGHGDWGPRISMRHGPRFPRGYDPRRILLGDVDGDGLADLVYVDDGRVTLWVNQSGNGWGDPITITGTPLVTDTGAVRMGDLFGLGIAGVLWSTEATAPGRPHHWFLDFTGGVKPYLLDAMNNHMGAVTRVEYAASTRYFLADQSDSRYRWRTPLPFPVQVVARVEVIDQISDGKLTTEYRYHHGYWDGAEREFRGFGMVEQFDSEQFVDYNGAGLHVDTYFRPVDVDHFAPPTLTRTWFHQGPIGPEEGDWAEVDRSHEYWAGDPPLLGHTTVVNAFLASLPHRRPDRLPDRRSRRDALRALRGRILRTELYADNGSTQRDRPYTVTEYAYGLREEKPPNTSNVDRPRIFFPYLIAERTTQWERGDDPLTTFSFTAGYDTFGQPQTQTTVACPRGWRHLDDRFKGYLATRTVTTYATPVVAADYIHDRVAEVSSYEIDPSRVATIAELRSLPAGNPSLRLISRILNFYDDNPAQPNNGAFVGRALGQVGNYGALVRSERLALTEHVIQQAYGGRLPHFAARGAVAWPAEYPHAFQQRLPAGAGYDYRPGGAADPYVDGYFIVAEQRRYDFHAGAGGRGLVRATRDPLGEETAIIYEAPYDHLPQKVTDPTGLETTATYAYRVLQPEKVTDPNGNETTFAFTPLGLLGATWVRGNPARNEGDRSRPGLHLSYDFLAGYRSDGREPIAVRSVRHTHHDTELDVPQPERDETIETREYSDGFGRLVQTRVQAEDVRFGNPTFGDGVLPAQQGHPADAQPVVGRLPANPSRPAVVVSGWKVYDNKGRVVEQYEPFFDEGWAFRPPGPRGERIQMYYDPRGRVVRTVNPDGSEQRVIYGVPADLAHPEEFAPTPWETYTYDANDNAGRTHRSQSRDYQEHWDTPASAVIDALGRVVRAIARTRAAGMLEQHHTTSTYDIRGNLLRVTDPLGRVVLTQVYDLADRPLRAESLDAGIRWTVLDARGGMLEQRHTGTGRLQLRAFDRLGRTSRLWARDDGTSLPTLREWLEYGDDEPNRTAARAANRLGRLHRYFDEAGLLQVESYDFKGNLTSKMRRVISANLLLAAGGGAQLAFYVVDWTPLDGPGAAAHAQATLDGTHYATDTAYDALGRVKSAEYPRDVVLTNPNDRRVLRPRYNRAGALERVEIERTRAGKVISTETFVERIAYNAKGQRTLVVYGNGLMTRQAYDPRTFRLLRMRTERATAGGPGTWRYTPAGMLLQDIAYAYDLAGNILRIDDRTPGCGYRNNPDAVRAQQAGDVALAQALRRDDALIRYFAYDPLYRLTRATGREDANIPRPRPWSDDQRAGFGSGRHATPDQDNAPNLTTGYWERYSYDPAGNMTLLEHGSNGTPDWTRASGVGGLNPQSWGQQWRAHLNAPGGWPGAPGNQLTYVIDGAAPAGPTHVYEAAGNLTMERGNRHYLWDHAGSLRLFAIQAPGAAPAKQAHYLYDGAGQRVTKYVREAGGYEMTVYIDGVFEHRRSVAAGGTVENSTLHVLDGQRRIVMIRVGPPLAGDTGPALQFHLGDHLGSSAVVVDGAGGWVNREEFYPYGETSFGSFARKRYRFTGKERDEESGLCYFGARYYASWLARWIASDPAELDDGLNLYGYVRQNPMRFTDQDGQWAGAAPAAEPTTRVVSTALERAAARWGSAQLISTGAAEVSATSGTFLGLGPVGWILAGIGSAALGGYLLYKAGQSYLQLQGAEENSRLLQEHLKQQVDLAWKNGQITDEEHQLFKATGTLVIQPRGGGPAVSEAKAATDSSAARSTNVSQTQVQKNAKVGAAGEKMAEFSLRHAHPNFAGASTLKRTLKNETGKTIYTGPNRTGARVTDVALPAEGGAVGTLEVKTLQEPIDPLIFAQGSSQLEKERKIMSQGQVYWGSSDNLCPVVPGEGPGVTTGWWQWYPPKDVQ